ncbi:MAG: TldD/PmbA family protein [candidate division NC10 bacterium]|nr:TldD/PmbA family protein [candidate division NC10 bacterium]
MVSGELLFELLKQALKKGGDLADIYLEQSRGTTIAFEDGRVERIIAGTDQGLGLRVIHQMRTLYGYTNDLSKASLLALAEGLSRAVSDGKGGSDLAVDLRRKDPPSLPVLFPPSEIPLQRKVQTVIAADQVARRIDGRIRQVKVTYRDSLRRITIANSEGFLATFDKQGITFAVQVVVADGSVIQTGFEPVGGTLGFELFEEDPPEQVARRAAERALLMLTARKAPAGQMPVVLSSEAGGTMIHEAVGHGLEADLALEGLSVYSGKLGQTIASPFITVVDDATLPRRRGSFPLDDEGVPAQRTVLAENGVLQSYLYDRLTAMQAGVPSTGNGRRESYHHKPIPRMTNTFIAPGDRDPQMILRSTNRGLFVRKMGGGQVNTVNGDFVFEVTEGYLIEGGEIGEPVRGATLIGNGPKILKDIDLVGSDLGFGIGTCGKDGQGVPVADAQPTLRIPNITVGGHRQA